MYGYFNFDDSQHSVRIRNVQLPHSADSVKYEGVKLFLTDLLTGIDFEMKDTVLNVNGQITNNYVINHPLGAGGKYGVRLEDGNGITSTSFTMPSNSMHSVRFDTLDGCYQAQQFYFTNVESDEFIILEAGVCYAGLTHWGTIQSVQKPEHIEGTDTVYMRLNLNNILVDIFPPPPEVTVGVPPVTWLPSVRCQQLESDEIQIRYIHFGADWNVIREAGFLEEGILDASTVENGVGFIGGINTGSFSFYADRPQPSTF